MEALEANPEVLLSSVKAEYLGIVLHSLRQRFPPRYLINWIGCGVKWCSGVSLCVNRVVFGCGKETEGKGRDGRGREILTNEKGVKCWEAEAEARMAAWQRGGFPQ